LRTVTIITTDPNETMKPIHDRMLVILPPSAWNACLDPTKALAKLLVPAPADLLESGCLVDLCELRVDVEPLLDQLDLTDGR
jgi:putative SOS response-associated peptidase YedK